MVPKSRFSISSPVRPRMRRPTGAKREKRPRIPRLSLSTVRLLFLFLFFIRLMRAYVQTYGRRRRRPGALHSRGNAICHSSSLIGACSRHCARTSLGSSSRNSTVTMARVGECISLLRSSLFWGLVEICAAYGRSGGSLLSWSMVPDGKETSLAVSGTCPDSDVRVAAVTVRERSKCKMTNQAAKYKMRLAEHL